MLGKRGSYSIAIALGIDLGSSGWLVLPARAEDAIATEERMAVAKAPKLHGLATAEAEPELVGVESTEAKVFSQAEEIAFIPA